MPATDGTDEEFIGAAAIAGDGSRVLRYAPTAALRAASRQEYGVALGWLIAALIVSVCLSVALAGSISGPLGALDAAVRQFDPELDRELPKPPAHAPREVIVVFEHLATVTGRLRDSYAQLRQALRKGERLRHELIHVIENREQEIEGRTEQLKQANATLDRLSRSDALTGVANRRGFAEFLDRAWRTGLREQRPLSILMIDIDHFKAYNDAYGHQRGDTCLKAVAEAICHVVGRAGDQVSRYGGEEFVVVLASTPLEGALQVAEQIRAAIQGLAIPHRGAPEHAVVTVTVGVTSTLPTRSAKPDVCLAAADRALYAAKEQGRNRVGYSTAAHTGLFQSLCLPNDPAPRPS
jgi:diguanylate cyclase (GGDEF)-like protein